MLSEKTYWIILIAGLIIFVFLIQFVLVPHEIIDYNLGFNLISESIGILFTIVFLTWLYSLREKNRWKVVKDEVYSSIGDNLSRIFDNVITYIENGHQIKSSLMKMENKETRKKACFTELCKLKNAKEITLDTTMLSLFLEDRDLLEYFVRIGQRLSDIESKYSEFLSPQLTISLIRIQDDLRALERVLEMSTTLKKIPQKLRKKFDLELESRISHDMVSMLFKWLIEEIYKIYEMGIAFSYP